MPGDGPFVVYLEYLGADQSCDGFFVGEYSNDVGMSFDLLVGVFERIGRMDLLPARLGEGFVGE